MSGVIQKNSVVTIAYTLLDQHGALLEERTSEAPLEYLQGHDHVLPALEQALLGQTSGYQTTLRVPAEAAYGPYDSELVIEMERSVFPAAMNLVPGMKFNTFDHEGLPVVVRVLEASEEMVVVDGNHPLAGVSLVFELRVLSVRDATSEEITNSHIETVSRHNLH